MSDATTLAPPAPRRVYLNEVVDALPRTTRRADVLVAVARALVGSSAYATGGRGLTGVRGQRLYDGLGFVRACVQHGRAWRPGHGWDPAVTTADLDDPAASPPRFNYVPYVQLLKAWGLQRQPGVHPFPVRAGDIVVSLGEPCLTVVTAAATHDRPATYAGVWVGETVTEGPYRDWNGRPPGQFWRMSEEG